MATAVWIQGLLERKVSDKIDLAMNKAIVDVDQSPFGLIGRPPNSSMEVVVEAEVGGVVDQANT